MTGSRAFCSALIILAALAPMFALSMPGSARAGERLTLEGLLAEARANNPDLKSVESSMRAKEARVRSEGALEDPLFKVEMEELSSKEPLRVSPRDAMDTKYTISQAIPFPGKLTLKEKAAEKDGAAARALLEARRLDVEFMVKDAYYDYAYVSESMEITREIKDLLSSMVKAAGARYSAGQASQQDVIRADVEAAMLEGDIIALEAEKAGTAARIKSLVNRPQDSELPEPDGLPRSRTDIDPDALSGKARTASPEIRMFEAEAESISLNRELADRGYYPDFMVGLTPIQRDSRFDNFSVMFQINIPIWTGKYSSRASEAASNLDAARFRLSSGRNAKALEVKALCIKARAADRTRALYETGLIPQARMSFDSALKNYSSGKIDFLTLIDSARGLKKARLDYLKIILDYRKSIAAIEKTVGVAL